MSSSVEMRLLFECVRQPWSSSAQMAVAAGMDHQQVAEYCERLAQEKLLQRATQSLSHLPRTIYAPTNTGVTTCAWALGLTMHQLGLTPERFWAMRASLDVTMEINAVCARTAMKATPARVVWETYIQRRNHKRPLYLHGRISILSENGVRAFYLLNDRGEGPVTVWYRHLRYYTLWARRQPIGFPTVLILTTRPFRAWALLVLARMSMGDSATELAWIKDSGFTASKSKGMVSFLATVERGAAIRDGLQTVSVCSKGWQTLLPNNTLVTVNPFTQQPIPVEVFERGVHSCHCVGYASSAGGAEQPRYAHEAKDPASPLSTPDKFEALRAIESLGDSEYRVLAFLCRHPVCPSSTIAAFTDLQEEALYKIIDTLQSLNLIKSAAVSQAQIKTRRRLPTLWLASEDAVRLRALRGGLDPDLALRRFHFFASDHKRRPYHTLAVHRVFEQLQRYCLQRSRATRYLDAVPGKPNEGRVDYYDLAVYDAELAASDHYHDGGQERMWRPDGYGSLRCGSDWTRFWLEIDGSSDIPSRAGLDTWFGKLGGLCDYYCSMRWRLRYPVFPRLLIITTNAQNLAAAHDALVISTRVRSILTPEVYMASADDVSRYGAMARVWHNVATENDGRNYAFDNAAPPGVA